MPLIPSPLRHRFEALLDPVARTLIAARVNPNTLTTFGTLVLVASGVLFGAGWVQAGGVLLLLSGIFDMLDGKVARLGAHMTRFGAFYDSTLDRVGEVSLFTGIAWFSLQGGVPPELSAFAVATCMITMGAATSVSYARARAEGLGLDGQVGVAQRADRILLLGIPSVLFGAGRNGWLLLALVGVLGVTSLVTVVQRILHVREQTRGDRPGPAIPARPAPVPPSTQPPPVPAEPAAKGTSARQETADTHH
jgi:CDP-diacylglycerol--glycerol-3-phosphate 3-phosphatidyltransferase